MKHLFTLFFISIGFFANTQNTSVKEYKATLNDGTLNLIDINEFELETHNGTEIIFSATIKNKKNSERSEGLMMLNARGLTDNSGFGLAITKEGNQVTATQIGNECNCKNMLIKVPKSVKIYVEHSSHNANDIVIKNVTSEIEITTNHHDITLDNVTGPMAIKTVYGSIVATFDRLSQNGSISLYSVYSFVDSTIPSSAKANLSMAAPYGNVYSNAEIKINAENTKKKDCGNCNNKAINGTYNGGGVEFSIKSSYDDVYVRTD